MTTTLLSFNSWSGGCPGFHSFIRKVSRQADYLALQEVHNVRDSCTPKLLMPQDPGSRFFPIRTHLNDELNAHLQDKWQTNFVPHVDGCHDLERDDRLQFGQFCAVRNETFEIICQSRKFIYGRHNQFNTEYEGGKPCGKVAIGHLLRRRQTDEYLIIVNVHGFWSKDGKCDSAARFEQNEGIQTLVARLQEHAPTDEVHIVVIGDLNYTSRMIALYDLSHQPCFGRGGGVILNHQFKITSTRTVQYKKPIREADFAIVSRSLLPVVSNFRVELENVPSDHGLLELTLKL